MRKILILFLVVVISSCISRKSNSNIIENWNGGLINSVGLYKLNNSTLLVDVNIKNKLLFFNVLKNKDTLIISSENISALHKWFLYLDETENLWFYSSDIGGRIWLNSPEGYKKRNLLDTIISQNNFPLEFKENIPKSYFQLIKKYD